ncbi:alkylation response protein AidB-like acyl-CoA dehydrogenase [Pseudoduganella lurida]|uniref:Alkylation response protein AidB-like acyl-CoA dehydrogenase n=1 Tax=Pseudoduganella lurida TaxID=1036180 RepID=A0A562RMV8_9BURK|nr:acyl-CoA dehydrogenase family protein [Pseudoduganella lurida]TWI69766.1 alkylation response protein AidB-like acyl-CoA dehydrogenase [Pseudoduganella lurida]
MLDVPTTVHSALPALRERAPAAALRQLVALGADRLPFPGQGATLARWRALAAVGAQDLGLAKLFEGHTDALAILHEAGMPQTPAGSLWGTWCAEPPDARVTLDAAVDGGYTVSGRKAWCSGARHVSHAVVSCWNGAGQAVLAAVDLRQPGVRVTDDGWHAVGMQGSESVDVHFDRVPATPLGDAGFYVRRAGFWHGGAGVAACWFGAATALADALRERLSTHADSQPDPHPDPHRLAQLGEVAVVLQASAALLRETAAGIDRAPDADAMRAALSVRLNVEDAARITLDRMGRALGPGPLCKDAAMARRFADLPVFIRQCHAERDQEAVGRLVASGTEAPWTL